MNESRRLHGLDLIRGLCAIAVMFYHYAAVSGWGVFVGVGTYGVYTFFTLSGFALSFVYGDRPISGDMLKDFFAARFARIAPLYVAICLVVFAINFGSDQANSRLVMQATFLFGITNPDQIASMPGGWSVGIEFAFYVLFPLLLLVRSIRGLTLLLVVSAAARYFYVRDVFTNPVLATRPGDDTYAAYIQVASFLCFFVAGILAERIYQRIDVRHSAAWLACAVASLALIFWAPYGFGISDRAWLMSPPALLLVLGTAVVVFLAALPGATSRLLVAISSLLGEVSYATYLLHMLMFDYIKSLAPSLDAHVLVGLSAAATLLGAWVTYRFFERPLRHQLHDLILRIWRVAPQRAAILRPSAAPTVTAEQ